MTQKGNVNLPEDKDTHFIALMMSEISITQLSLVIHWKDPKERKSLVRIIL